MEYETLDYKGSEIIMIHEDDEKFFKGCYIKTIWFPDIDRAKDFIDRMSVQEMDH